MTQIIAGIDVHKRMLMVAVSGFGQNIEEAEGQDGVVKKKEVITEAAMATRRFGTTVAELRHLVAWLGERGVEEVVMESTAQYWKPVWLGLEAHFKLQLAQAWSNRAPRGKKTDFKDAQRLVRRHFAGELTLSYVPEEELRQMRMLTRRRTQLSRERVRVQNQLEALLEEGRIKLSSVITDLLGSSGLRILAALADGVQDPQQLAALGDERLKCSPEQLAEALAGTLSPIQRKLVRQFLDQIELLDKQMDELTLMAAESMRKHSDAVTRLARIPGIRAQAAQQIVAEAGPRAKAFPTAKQFSAWIGCCPGRNESAGENHSSRCPKGNMYLRRTLCQAAQAAVRTKNSYFQQKFNRLVPRLGYSKAIWAMVRHMAVVIWKVLHEGVEYEERGLATTPEAAKRRRAQRLAKELKALGYPVELKPAKQEEPGK